MCKPSCDRQWSMRGGPASAAACAAGRHGSRGDPGQTPSPREAARAACRTGPSRPRAARQRRHRRVRSQSARGLPHARSNTRCVASGWRASSTPTREARPAPGDAAALTQVATRTEHSAARTTSWQSMLIVRSVRESEASRRGPGIGGKSCPTWRGSDPRQRSAASRCANVARDSSPTRVSTSRPCASKNSVVGRARWPSCLPAWTLGSSSTLRSVSWCAAR